MPDQTTALLQEKLEKIKRARRISTITMLLVMVASGLLVDLYFNFDLIPGLLITLGIASLAAFIANWYYGIREVVISRKIEKLPREKPE